ncbi:MAG: ATP-binding protein [Chloroflexota bacterium]
MKRLFFFLANYRFRLAVIFLTIAISTFLYFGVATYQGLSVELPQLALGELRTAMLAVEGRIESRMEDGTELQTAANDVFSQALDRRFHARAYDRWGNIVATTSSLPGNPATFNTAMYGQGMESTLVVPPDNVRYLLITMPLRVRGEIVGAVELALSLQDVDRTLAVIYPRLALGVILSVVAIFAAAMYVGGNLTRIIGELEVAARAIAQGHFDQRIAVTSTDELGQLARTINYMASELQRLSAVRAEFLSKVSHELRTPLTIIKGFTVSMLREAASPARRRQLEVVDSQVDHLTGLVEDLLDLSRLDAGTLRLRRESMDLVRISQEAVDVTKPKAQMKNITLNYRAGAPSIEALGDPHRVKQIIDNLLDNALKHTEPGGRITVEVTARNSEAVIKVADTGLGIPRESLPYVFDRFYQVYSQRKAGAGLGLAVVKELTEAHGGRVEVESEIGAGSTFTVVLPIQATPQ